jgi:hypothetical protein
MFRDMRVPLWDRVTGQVRSKRSLNPFPYQVQPVQWWAANCAFFSGDRYFLSQELTNNAGVPFGHATNVSPNDYVAQVHAAFTNVGAITHAFTNGELLIINKEYSVWETNPIVIIREPGVVRLTTRARKNAAAASGKKFAVAANASFSMTNVEFAMVFENTNARPPFWKPLVRDALGHKNAAALGIEVLDSLQAGRGQDNQQPVAPLLHFYGVVSHKNVYCDELMLHHVVAFPTYRLVGENFLRTVRAVMATNYLTVV